MIRALPATAFLLFVTGYALADSRQQIQNPLTDYVAFTKAVEEVGSLRKDRRISEEEFIRMAKEPGTVVLDARSERLFALRHIQGAVNLSLPEFTAETLAKVLPAKDTRVLIYCNNNFLNAPGSMPAK